MNSNGPAQAATQESLEQNLLGEVKLTYSLEASNSINTTQLPIINQKAEPPSTQGFKCIAAVAAFGLVLQRNTSSMRMKSSQLADLARSVDPAFPNNLRSKTRLFVFMVNEALKLESFPKSRLTEQEIIVKIERSKAHIMNGEYQKAEKELDWWESEGTYDRIRRFHLARSYAKQDRLKEAIEINRGIVKEDPSFHSALYNNACYETLSNTGRNEFRARLYLETLFKVVKSDSKKVEWYADLLQTDPDFSSVRNQKWFKQVQNSFTNPPTVAK